MWMKGYVESAVPVPDSSRFLYVELLDGESGEAALRSKVRLGEEGFAGYLDLPENLPGGHYVLRAYTRWQLNWPASWMFHAPIQIYDGTEPAPAEDDGVVDADYEVVDDDNGISTGNTPRLASRPWRRTGAACR